MVGHLCRLGRKGDFLLNRTSETDCAPLERGALFREQKWDSGNRSRAASSRHQFFDFSLQCLEMAGKTRPVSQPEAALTERSLSARSLDVGNQPFE